MTLRLKQRGKAAATNLDEAVDDNSTSLTPAQLEPPGMDDSLEVIIARIDALQVRLREPPPPLEGGEHTGRNESMDRHRAKMAHLRSCLSENTTIARQICDSEHLNAAQRNEGLKRASDFEHAALSRHHVRRGEREREDVDPFHENVSEDKESMLILI